ncbi:hypothetical protein CYMTET_18262 [Cymbomonas tetramitiformis]|uniref:Uncharacterized protein n=1 Tax=Cymbomonas tetramitiformis TaxID=36881 RepID=A0AAE0L6F9_9CHLO|nr:hypothetical protein CYMTET_18262 [Cymbomonas tetramitiformis]
MVKHAWTREEDNILIGLVRTWGAHRWLLISKAGKEAKTLNRDSKSCRLRWKNQLSGAYSRNPFSCEEDFQICQMHAIIGDKWAEIARRLNRKRSDNQVKNRFNSHILRCQLRMLEVAYKNHALGLLPQELYESLRHVKRKTTRRTRDLVDMLATAAAKRAADLPATTTSEHEVNMPVTATTEYAADLPPSATSDGGSKDTTGSAPQSSMESTSVNGPSGATLASAAHLLTGQDPASREHLEQQCGMQVAESFLSSAAPLESPLDPALLQWQWACQEAMRMGCSHTYEATNQHQTAVQDLHWAPTQVYHGLVIASGSQRRGHPGAEPTASSRVVQYPRGAPEQQPRLDLSVTPAFARTPSDRVPAASQSGPGHKSAFTAVRPNCSRTARDAGSLNIVGAAHNLLEEKAWSQSENTDGSQLEKAICAQLENTAGSQLEKAICAQLNNAACVQLESTTCGQLEKFACDQLENTACNMPNSPACNQLKNAACDHVEDTICAQLKNTVTMNSPVCVEEPVSGDGKLGGGSTAVEAEMPHTPPQLAGKAGPDNKRPRKRSSSAVVPNERAMPPAKACKRARDGTVARSKATDVSKDTLSWAVKKLRSDPQKPRDSPAAQALYVSMASPSELEPPCIVGKGNIESSCTAEWKTGMRSMRRGASALLHFWTATASSPGVEKVPWARPPRSHSGRRNKNSNKKVSNYRAFNNAGFDQA